MEDTDPCVVSLRLPRSVQMGHHRADAETWITMMEQFLSCHCTGYTVTVQQDSYNQTTDLSIRFASIEDAVWFRLRYNH